MGGRLPKNGKIDYQEFERDLQTQIKIDKQVMDNLPKEKSPEVFQANLDCVQQIDPNRITRGFVVKVPYEEKKLALSLDLLNYIDLELKPKLDQNKLERWLNTCYRIPLNIPNDRNDNQLTFIQEQPMTQMAAAPVLKTDTTDKSSIKKKKVLSSKPEDRVYVIDETGVMVLNRDAKNKLIPEGIIDPESFFAGFVSDKPVNTGFLAPNVRYYERLTNTKKNAVNHIFMFEFEPRMASIIFHFREDYQTDNGVHEEKNFDIALPYLQYFIALNEVQNKLVINYDGYLTCTNKSVTSLADSLFQLPINNIDVYGHICWGTSKAITHKPGESPSQLAYRACQTFFTTPFNNHLPPRAIVEWPNYETWATKSKADPGIALKTKYNALGNGGTPNSIINQLRTKIGGTL